MKALKHPVTVFILISGLLVFLVAGCLVAYRFEVCYYRNRGLIEAASLRYQVPAKLVGAVIWQETRFNQECRGNAGEIGLMQIMPGSAREWAKVERVPAFDPETLIDPGTNILAGTWYLGRAIKRWSAQPDPLPYALAEYNAGRSNALRWDRSAGQNPDNFTDTITYPTTRAYVKRVLRNYRSFGQPWQRWGSE